jgi:hypothetical protein
MTAGVGRAFPLVQTAGDGLDAGRHIMGEEGIYSNATKDSLTGEMKIGSPNAGGRPCRWLGGGYYFLVKSAWT